MNHALLKVADRSLEIWSAQIGFPFPSVCGPVRVPLVRVMAGG